MINHAFTAAQISAAETAAVTHDLRIRVWEGNSISRIYVSDRREQCGYVQIDQYGDIDYEYRRGSNSRRDAVKRIYEAV